MRRDALLTCVYYGKSLVEAANQVVSSTQLLSKQRLQIGNGENYDDSSAIASITQKTIVNEYFANDVA